MKKVLTLYKPLGKTPLEVVQQYKMNNPEYTHTKIAYAGRLDPMAEGKLLLLVGDTCKQRQKYLNLDKEYEFEVLLGVSSDTHDILGLTTNDTILNDAPCLENILRICRGKIELPYPVFSSKTVEGKPLFLWALEERLSEIQIPTKEVEIYKLEQISEKVITKDVLLQTVQKRIALVTQVTEDSKQLGRDFRRKEVLEKWERNIKAMQQDEFVILKLRCICSSGTYMRTLASIIGKQLGTGGLAWSIKRSKIGTYKKLFRQYGFWVKQY